MKKVIILGALAAILSFSCNNDKNERDASTTNAIGYKISELPTSPSFAKPIKEAGEVRKFDLIKKDGSKLNFELTSIKQTLFGKMRTLVGTVSTGDTKKEKAIMIVGENGFELFYSDNGQDFKLKGKNELNIGIKMNNFNLEGKSRTQFLAYAKKKGLDGNLMLDNLNKKAIDTESRYEVAVEQSNQYTLLNQTAASQKKESVEGELKCGTDALPFPTSEKLHKSNSTSAYRPYEIEVVYMEDTFNFDNVYAALLISLYSVDSEFENNQAILPIVSQYEGRPNNPDFPLSVDQKNEYIATFGKISDAYEQLKKVNEWVSKTTFYKSGRVIRVALYKGYWDGGVQGLAHVDQYKDSSWYPKYSTLIAADYYANTFAHECGHNLGAVHVETYPDLMYKSVSYWYQPDKHNDAANIAKIKASLKY